MVDYIKLLEGVIIELEKDKRLPICKTIKDIGSEEDLVNLKPYFDKYKPKRAEGFWYPTTEEYNSTRIEIINKVINDLKQLKL